jgi:hypothetical protein
MVVMVTTTTMAIMVTAITIRANIGDGFVAVTKAIERSRRHNAN